MNYMLDRIKLLPKKDYILKTAEKMVKDLKNNKNLDDSEKIMTIELAMAQLNYDLYKVSGDKSM